MALQTSGAISLLNIANEFGGSAPHSLSEYYGAASGIPSSGTISFSQFYGTSNIVTHTLTNSGGLYFQGSPTQVRGTTNISPGISVSSTITIYYSGGSYDLSGSEQEWVAAYINGTMYRPSSGGTYTWNFSGTITSFGATSTHPDGDPGSVEVVAIDGGPNLTPNFTYVNSSTITTVP